MTFRNGFNTFMRGWASSIGYTSRGRVPVLPNPGIGFQRDAEAIASDWKAIGNDMWTVFNSIKAEADGVPA